jgi:fructoselysine-6-P-deglycase FrlB-like protein
MSAIERRLAALEDRNAYSDARPALVQVIAARGRTAEQKAAADLAAENGTEVIEVVFKDASRPKARP